MTGGVVIKTQEKTTNADARHTLVRFLTDFVYEKAGRSIPWYADRGENQNGDNIYRFTYGSIRGKSGVTMTQSFNRKFNFDSWQVLHHADFNGKGEYLEIKMYRGKTEYNEFLVKRGTTPQTNGIFVQDWIEYLTK